MANYFEVDWLDEVKAEYRGLLNVGSRDLGVDVGNQFRAYERIIEKGLDLEWRSIGRAGSSDLYVMYGRRALMFFAVAGRRIAVVEWTTLGTPYEQTLARDAARARAALLYPPAAPAQLESKP
jgi:hypothetical protein